MLISVNQFIKCDTENQDIFVVVVIFTTRYIMNQNVGMGLACWTIHINQGQQVFNVSEYVLNSTYIVS